MSDLFPKVTSDEIDLDAAAEQAKREEELSQIVHHITRVNQLSAQVPAQAYSVLSLFLQNLFYKTPNL